MNTEKSFEKSFLNIVQLFEIEVVPSIKNKVFYSLHILKGFYTSLPEIIGGGGGGPFYSAKLCNLTVLMG